MALEGPELGWNLNALSENDFVDSTNAVGYLYIGEQNIIKDE